MKEKKEKRNVYVPMKVVKGIVFALVDALIIFLCFATGLLAQFGTISSNDFIYIAGLIVFKLIVATIFGIYNTNNDHFNITDAIRFCSVILLSNVLVAVIAKFFIKDLIEQPSIFTLFLITTAEMVAVVVSRCVVSIFRFYSGAKNCDKRTMVIGAGMAGKLAYDEMHNNPDFKNNIVCFLDNNPDKIGTRYLGKRVVGPDSKMKEYIEKYNIQEVIIAINDLSKEDLKKKISEISKYNVSVKRLPILSETTISTEMKIKEVSLAELLGRDQITFDTKEISEFITGRRVLVTGAGGSIGSELVKQIYSFRPSSLVLFDIYENSTYDIQQDLVRMMKAENSDMELHTIIGSTYNEFRVEEIFKKYRPELVFHAAAYKHVPLMEDSPVEAIRTNVIGTYNVAKMASKYNVIKMTLVSTDKAVRPTNTMGATKAFAEMIIRCFDSVSPNTSFSAVRFGNVLGSNGSVIPLFKKQIAEGGPVTVTHKDIIRYFMTIPEAVSLILQSATYAKGGEIFILDMGEPVKILTLAENVIKQCGFIPYKDIDITFTDLRPGEKLYEELLINATENEKTDNKKIFIEKKRKIQPIEEEIKYISDALFKTDNDEIKDMLRHVVTSFTNYKEFNKAHKDDNPFKESFSSDTVESEQLDK